MDSYREYDDLVLHVIQLLLNVNSLVINFSRCGRDGAVWRKLVAGSSSKKAIIAAFLGNFLIAITKFGAAAITGSSAMFSEAVHSVVDTGNQLLLLYGLRRAARPPDHKHPFGYGKELYFWSFVVAILIFGLGAGISIYEGVHKIQNPAPITRPIINYAVLGLAIVFELAALSVAFRKFRKTMGGRGFLAEIRRSKDPSLFTILFEDTAAVLGLLVAFLGIYLSNALGLPMLDGLASVGIGIILAITAARAEAWMVATAAVSENQPTPLLGVGGQHPIAGHGFLVGHRLAVRERAGVKVRVRHHAPDLAPLHAHVAAVIDRKH